MGKVPAYKREVWGEAPAYKREMWGEAPAYKRGVQGAALTYKKEPGGKDPQFRIDTFLVNIFLHGPDDVWIGNL